MSAASPTFAEAPTQEARAPSVWSRFAGMILRPARTLDGLTEADAWLWPSVMLLAGYTLFYLPIAIGLSRFGASILSQTLMSARNSPPPPTAAFQVVRSVIPVVYMFGVMLQVPVYVAITWATRTTLFYALARLLGGEKPFWGRVVAMVGWAWVPLFIQYALVGIAMLVSPKLFSILMYMPDPRHPVPTAAMMRSRWLTLGLRELSPLVLWNLYLCTIGVKQLFGLPRWKAALVVLLPMVLYALFEIASLWIANQMSSAFSTAGGPVGR